MYDTKRSRQATIQNNVFLFIEYLYWVTFSFLALGAFLIVLFITVSPGPAILAFSIPAIICGLLIYPKNLAKETIPLFIEMRKDASPSLQERIDFRLSDSEDEANPLELGDRFSVY